VALAFVLLVSASLLIRSFARLTAQETGVRADHVSSLRVNLPAAAYSQAAEIRTFYQRVQERLAVIPGVAAVSVSTDLPVHADGERRAFTPERNGEIGGLPPSIVVTWIHGDYFKTFGVPIVSGRTFGADEQFANRGAVIVSAAVAARFWPGEDAVGKRIKWGLQESAAPWYTIVGVAGDVVDGPLGSEPPLHAYVPFAEVPDAALAAPINGLVRNLTLALRTEIDPAAITSAARRAVNELDPALAIYDIRTMTEVLGEASAPQRFSATVLAVFSAGALLLAGVGLYGVVAFTVGQRTREIGVRVALGADRTRVLALVLRQGMTLVGLGLVFGALATIASGRLIAALLFEMTAFDAITYTVVPLVLVSVSLLACYVPARRAATTSPVTALRAE
jgi:predicted permease